MKTAFLQTPGQGSEGIGCSTGNTAPSPSHSLSSTTHLCGDESVSCNSSKAGEAFPAAQRAGENLDLEFITQASSYVSDAWKSYYPHAITTMNASKVQMELICRAIGVLPGGINLCREECPTFWWCKVLVLL